MKVNRKRNYESTHERSSRLKNGAQPIDALDDDEDLGERTPRARMSLRDGLEQASLEVGHVVVCKHLDGGAWQPHPEHQRRMIQRVRDHTAPLQFDTRIRLPECIYLFMNLWIYLCINVNHVSHCKLCTRIVSLCTVLYESTAHLLLFSALKLKDEKCSSNKFPKWHSAVEHFVTRVVVEAIQSTSTKNKIRVIWVQLQMDTLNSWLFLIVKIPLIKAYMIEQ